MKTELKTKDRFMIIIAVSGLILATVAFLMPDRAEAGIVVRAQIGSIGVAVATDSPRGVIVQTGPRTYRCDPRVRPLRPRRGRFVWVPGHYEKVLVVEKCRKIHRIDRIKPGKGHGKRTKNDYQVKGKRGRKGKKHNHYREVWVTGQWVRA
jgi:hypothetical protein